MCLRHKRTSLYIDFLRPPAGRSARHAQKQKNVEKFPVHALQSTLIFCFKLQERNAIPILL